MKKLVLNAMIECNNCDRAAPSPSERGSPGLPGQG